VERFGQRIRHVHRLDAEASYIHDSIGRGRSAFADAVAALAEVGYQGKFSLELETRDVTKTSGQWRRWRPAATSVPCSDGERSDLGRALLRRIAR
jgi:sugar phosphate isomerase/epimerase